MNNIEKALHDLLRRKEFYAHFFLNSKIVYDMKGVPTAGACVTKNGPKLIFNRQFMEKMTVQQAVGVIEHEILHLLFEHTEDFSKNPEDTYTKNIAMDCAINQFITHLPEGCVTLEGLSKAVGKQLLPKETWQYYYEAIKEKQEEMKAAGLCTSDEHVKDDEAIGGAQGRAQIKSTMDQAAKQARGNLPEEVQKVFNSYKEHKLPWKQLLRNFVASCRDITRINTKKKRNRRFDDINVPGSKKKRELVLGVCADSSGSVSDEHYNQFISEVVNISKFCTKVYFIEADCMVHEITTIKRNGKPKLERNSCGGTAYSPAIEKCVELRVDAILYFGDFDSSDVPNNPGIPFLWVGVGTQEPPANFGQVIRLD